MSGLNKKILLILLFLFLLGMAFISYSSLFGYVQEAGIGREALAAALGALFVILATGVQLHQQTDMEVERHKKQLTYANRLSCYTDLLKTKSEFEDQIITDKKFQIVANQKLLAHLICENEDTLSALSNFLVHIYNINERHDVSGKKTLNDLELGELTSAYEHLATMLMLDLKGGLKNLSKSDRDAVENAQRYLSSNQSVDNYSGSKVENNHVNAPKRNTSKIRFNGVEYTKKLYVYKVMSSYVEKKQPSFSELKQTYQQEKLSKIDGLNLKDATQHFNGANPFWLELDKAREKKKRSTEGDRWDRYWIEEDMLLNFNDGKRIALRNGQDTKSVEVFQKWCEANGIPFV